MRSDHDKLDRQIDELLGKRYDKEDDYTEDDGSRQVIVDRKYAYDDIKGDTRKIYELDDLKDEEEVEEEIVKPTRMSRVARLEEEYEDEEKPTYLVKEDKYDDNINFPLLIIGALFFIVAFVSMVVFFVYF